MYYTKEQVMNGIGSYIDNEVIVKLPTYGKWIAGSAIMLAMRNAQELVNKATSNDMVKMLGVVNEDGLIEADKLTEALKENAVRYGNVQVCFPLLGQMTFTPSDIDLIRRYIT